MTNAMAPLYLPSSAVRCSCDRYVVLLHLIAFLKAGTSCFAWTLAPSYACRSQSRYAWGRRDACGAEGKLVRFVALICTYRAAYTCSLVASNVDAVRCRHATAGPLFQAAPLYTQEYATPLAHVQPVRCPCPARRGCAACGSPIAHRASLAKRRTALTEHGSAKGAASGSPSDFGNLYHFFAPGPACAPPAAAECATGAACRSRRGLLLTSSAQGSQ